MLKQNPKLNKIEDICPVKGQHGFMFRKNKRTERLINRYFRLPQKQASNGVYSPRRDKFKVVRKERNTILRSVINFLKNGFYSIPRSRYKSISENTEDAANTENRSLHKRLSRIISGAKFLKPLRSLASMRGNKKVYLKKALALITIIAVIITAYFQNSQTVSVAAETL